MSGRTLAAVLAAIVLLTFVLPPIAAREVHLRRFGRAREAVERLATGLGSAGGPAPTGVAGQTGLEPFVLAGRGAAPVFAPGVDWPTDGVPSLNAVTQHLFSRSTPGAGASIDDSPDPWGNEYLVVLGRQGPGRSVIVICAGPNGMIETPFGSVSSPKGDDIVAVR